MVRTRSQRIRHAAEGRLAIKTAKVRRRFLENEVKVRKITPEDVLQFYGVKNYKASGGSYFCASATQCRFFYLNSAGRTWNDNVIWVKGVKSLVARIESLLDEVAKDKAELKFVLEGLSLSRKKRVNSRSKKVQKTLSTRSMAGADDGKKQATGGEGQTNLAKTPGIDSSIQPEPLKLSKIAQKYPKKLMLRALPTSGTTGSGDKVAERRPAVVDDLKEVEERARLAALHEEEDTRKMMEVRANLDKMVEEYDRLGRHLMLKGYYEEEVDAIKADTYVEEGDDEEVEVVGVMDGLDGVSHREVLDNQGDDTKLPEGDNKKGELDSARSHEDDVLECNQEFTEELDRMREANENREDQHVNVHYKLVEVTQAIFNLNYKVEEKDAKIGKGLKELAEMIKHAAKLQIRVDALMVKCKPAEMAQYRIQALERSNGQFRYDLQNCRNELER
ncbi:hypothetical protein GIB67_025212 [Kingdonia uniflora]|uniref:Uncharacterized protein n=1 Tax=Kingdonia uniflora TaxID=39325 RepID=A0A7J7N8Y7_9MAGN|nr:hypothetical protein GIB67_025212 [Kingdonia uniflora]